MITFDKFAAVLYGAMGSEENNGIFTQELFYKIINCEKDNPLDAFNVETFHKYFNGTRQISRMSKKIKKYVDMELFAAYLRESCSDAVAVDIQTKFAELGITISLQNFHEEVAEIFNSIILSEVTPARVGIGQDLSRYLDKLISRYNKLKTLLYYNEPQPFYDFYVPNDIYNSNHKRLNADKLLLGTSRKFTVITGTGGIGKSMMMKHLALQLASRYDKFKKIPILVQLKEYNSKSMNLMDAIEQSIKIADLKEKLQSGCCVLLLDAMDEIKSKEIKAFEKELCEFVEQYPNNTYIMSSRPIGTFISLSRFEIYRMAPFTKAQALKLIMKLKHRPEMPEIKENFYKELDSSLYESHKDFAENPLLLTIMLMTYEKYARIPYKRHVFYKYAFNTLVEKHDATKTGFSRIFKTQMIPEEFDLVLQEFCGRTYFDEKFEFTEDEFRHYFDKLKCLNRINKTFTCQDLIEDLTLNLCILTFDNGKYCFIHRSFQEYFCALKLSKSYDDDFKVIQAFFEERPKRIAADYTFDMMYDLAPDKIEKFIFIPYLTELFEKCGEDEKEAYWNFLEIIYPEMFSSNGDVLTVYETPPESFVYEALIRLKGTDRRYLTDLPTDGANILEEYICVTRKSGSEIIDKDDFNSSGHYTSVEDCGCNISFKPHTIRNMDCDLRDEIESNSFPLHIEFRDVQRIFADMKAQEKRSHSSAYSSIFD